MVAQDCMSLTEDEQSQIACLFNVYVSTQDALPSATCSAQRVADMVSRVINAVGIGADDEGTSEATTTRKQRTAVLSLVADATAEEKRRLPQSIRASMYGERRWVQSARGDSGERSGAPTTVPADTKQKGGKQQKKQKQKQGDANKGSSSSGKVENTGTQTQGGVSETLDEEGHVSAVRRAVEKDLESSSDARIGSSDECLDIEALLETRFVHAAYAIAGRVARMSKNKSWCKRIAIVDGSVVAALSAAACALDRKGEDISEAMVQEQGAEASPTANLHGVHGGRKSILVLGAGTRRGSSAAVLANALDRDIVVEVAPLAAAGSGLLSSSSCDALVIGADAVHADGRLVVAAGIANVARMSTENGIPVIAVIQTIKFTDEAVLAEVDAIGLEILNPGHVSVVVTEHGEFDPRDAPIVFDKFCNVEVA